MKKSQMFSPIYSVIFAAVIVSLLIIFSTIINEWRTSSLLQSDLVLLRSSLNILSEFDSFTQNLNTTNTLNVTINVNKIILSNGNKSLSIENSFRVNSNTIINANHFTIVKNGALWVIS